jgi:hypothetical protein
LELITSSYFRVAEEVVPPAAGVRP